MKVLYLEDEVAFSKLMNWLDFNAHDYGYKVTGSYVTGAILEKI